MTWSDDAACRDTDVADWFPAGDGSNLGRPPKSGRDPDDYVPAELRRICETCPAAACLSHALRHELYGIWAATSERQRIRMRRSAGITLEIPGIPDRADSADDEQEAIA